MQIVINPKDNNQFASASLDRTIKVWQLGSSSPNFTLEGHEKGVNCIDYYSGGDKPYLISGADDRLVKIWDYQNKTCVQTLEVMPKMCLVPVFIRSCQSSLQVQKMGQCAFGIQAPTG